MKKLLLFFIILYSSSIAQTVYLKREFRGAWVATVSNLDWPATKNNVTAQLSEMTTLFDSLKKAGINAVIFQVRPAADAFYNSSIEPWSYWLTGTQGTAPSPLYDPLATAITEAHNRNIELHAWFNPYRAINGTYTLAANHVINQHPDWILTVGAGQKKILNPGLPEVRSYVLTVIADVIRRYNIDGVHMDDYFYPYPSDNITTEDTATFRLYPRGFTNIGNWRRDNVNLLIGMIMDSVNSIKPYIKFGMSPFGIWKNGVPSGITGMDAYSTIFCDAITWVQNQDIDYLTPQLYWKIGGSQDYSKLLNWWADSVFAHGRHFYPGQSFSAGYTNSELPNQVILNRANSKVSGNILFRSNNIKVNTYYFKDSLQQTYNLYPALHPVMTWKDNIAPLAPISLTATNVSNSIRLSWTKPGSASDGDYVKKFVIYRSTTSTIDTSDPKNIIYVSPYDTSQYTDGNVTLTQKYYYCLTSLDKLDNESPRSNIAMATAGSDVTVLENFESGVGLFNRSPTYSGSTYGIATTSSQSASATSHSGSGGLQIILKDSAASSNDWRARILSGSGSPANNSALPVVGSIIIWVKTSSAGANGKIAITVDDAAGGTEISAQQSITNDGAWHSYSFDLQGTGWTSFAGGNGKIDGSTITLDAVILYNSNAAPDWTLYLDDITFSSSGTPLPVELNSFIAEVKNSKVMLKWQTQTEINNYGFEIERYTPSINNLSWKVIGFVEGNGNSNSPKQYRFTDIKPIYNTALRYRLKQIDLDGSYQYSPEVETIVRDEDIKLNQNYPNPFNPATVISYTLPNIGKIRVKLAIYDLLGRQVAVLIDEIQHEGNYTVNFNSANYSMGSGIYFYKLTVGESNFVKKMILMK